MKVHAGARGAFQPIREEKFERKFSFGYMYGAAGLSWQNPIRPLEIQTREKLIIIIVVSGVDSITYLHYL